MLYLSSRIVPLPCDSFNLVNLDIEEQATVIQSQTGS